MYVRRLALALEQEGYSPWVDDRIDYGSTWDEEVEKRLDDCAAFILVMTPNSSVSRWVKNELNRAMRKNKPIFPLLLEGEEPWLAVESIQFMDVRGGKLPDERFYQHLSNYAAREKPVQEVKPSPAREPTEDKIQPEGTVEKALIEELHTPQPEESVLEKEFSPAEIPIEQETPEELIPVDQVIAAETEAPPDNGKRVTEGEIPPVEIPIEVGSTAGLVPTKLDTREEIPPAKIPIEIETRDLVVEKKTEERQVPPQRIKKEKQKEIKPARIRKTRRTGAEWRKELSRAVIAGAIMLVAAGVGGTLWAFREPLGLTASSGNTSTREQVGVFYTSTEKPTEASLELTNTPITVDNAEQVEEVMRWGDGGVINQMVLTTAGELIAVGTSQGVTLLDAVHLWESPSSWGSIWEDRNGVTTLALSPDGRSLAVDSHKSILVKKLDGTELYNLDAGELVNSLAFNGDGSYLAAGVNSFGFKVWSMEDGSLVYTSRDYGTNVTAVLFNPGGGLLATGASDGEIQVWQIPEGTLFMTLDGPAEGVLSLAFSPDGNMLAAGGADGYIRIWSIPSGELLYELDGLTHRVQSVAFYPEGFVLASGTENGRIYLWKPEESDKPVETLEGYHTCQIRSLAFTPDKGTLISAALDGSVIRWLLDPLTPVAEFTDFLQPVVFTALSPDGALLAYEVLEGSIYVEDIFSENPSMALKGLPDLFGIGFSRDGKKVVSVSSVVKGVWNIPNEYPMMVMEDLPVEITSAAFHPERDEIAVGYADATIRFYDFSGVLLDSWSTDQIGNAVRLLEYSPGGKYLATSYQDGLLVVWQEMEPIKRFFLEGLGVMKAMTFTPDSGTLLLAGDDGRLRSISMESGEMLDISIPGLDGPISMEFSPDGKMLALGMTNYDIMLADYEFLSVFTTLEGHTGYVTSITFLPDASLLISTSMDGTTRLWGVGE